jgi:hypothetical protein
MLPPAQPAAGDRPALFCARAARRFPVGRGFDLLRLAGGHEHLVPSAIARALDRWGRFRTEEEHVETFAHMAAGAPPEVVRRAFRDLLRKDVIVSDGQLVDALRRSAGPAQAARIDVVVCPSHDRVASLERSLRRLTQNVLVHGRRPELVVSVDSGDPGVEEGYRALLAASAKATGLATYYAGRREKCAFIDRLAARSGVPAGVLEFGLLPTPLLGATPGSNFNCLLLETAGRCALRLDDDVLVGGWSMADARGVAISATGYGQLLPFQQSEELRARLSFEERDFIGDHQRFLGASVGQCLAEAGSASVDLRGVSAEMIADLEVDRPRIVATQSSVWGDGGSSGAAHYLFLRGLDFRQLVQSEGHYHAAIRSRQVWKGVERVTLSASAFFQSMAAAYDNRTLLPPFAPVPRGSDGLFGEILSYIRGDGYVAYLPWAVEHDPCPRRANDPALVWSGGERFHLDNLLSLAMRTFMRSPGARREGGRSELASFLMELGGLPAGEFAARLRDPFLELVATTVDELERLLNVRARRPRCWAVDAVRFLNAIHRLVQSDQPLAPLELRSTRSPLEALARGQEVVAMYGQLLARWPEIVAGTQDLHAQGHRLAARMAP